MIAAAAFAAALSASSDDYVQHLARQPRTGGLIDVSDFNDRAMVRQVAPAPCAARNFVRPPEAGWLRSAQHAPSRN